MISDAEINALEAWYLHCADTQENPNGGRILALIKRLRDAEKERDEWKAACDQTHVCNHELAEERDQLQRERDALVSAGYVNSDSTRNAIIEQCAEVCRRMATHVEMANFASIHNQTCWECAASILALKETP